MERQTLVPAATTTSRPRHRPDRCVRCGGNLFLNQEDECWEQTCLQCGRSYPLHQVLPKLGSPVRVRVAA